MSNPARGEVEISIIDRTFTVRPTFQMIAEIERKTGQSIIAISRRMAIGDVSMTDVADILFIALKRQPDAPNTSQIGTYMMRKGMTRYLTAVSQLLTAALSGTDGPDEEPPMNNSAEIDPEGEGNASVVH